MDDSESASEEICNTVNGILKAARNYAEFDYGNFGNIDDYKMAF